MRNVWKFYSKYQIIECDRARKQKWFFFFSAYGIVRRDKWYAEALATTKGICIYIQITYRDGIVPMTNDTHINIHMYIVRIPSQHIPNLPIDQIDEDRLEKKTRTLCMLVVMVDIETWWNYSRHLPLKLYRLISLYRDAEQHFHLPAEKSSRHNFFTVIVFGTTTVTHRAKMPKKRQSDYGNGR